LSWTCYSQTKRKNRFAGGYLACGIYEMVEFSNLRRKEKIVTTVIPKFRRTAFCMVMGLLRRIS